MKTFSTFLGEDMRPLTPAELKKPNSKTGELRIEILRKAILSGNTPLTLVNNSDVVFKNSADNLSALQKFQDDSKSFELETVDGKTVVSSQLGKSPIRLAVELVQEVVQRILQLQKLLNACG